MRKLFAIVMLLVILSMLMGCRTRYVPIETVRTEYHHTTDTVRQTDSIVKERETIIREADSSQLAALGIELRKNERAILVLQRELERERSQRREYSADTIVKVDTISEPYPVEKKLSAWDRLKYEGKGFLFALLLFVVIIVCVVVINPTKLWLK